MYLSEIFIENFRIFGAEEEGKHLRLNFQPGLNVCRRERLREVCDRRCHSACPVDHEQRVPPFDRRRFPCFGSKKGGKLKDPMPF